MKAEKNAAENSLENAAESGRVQLESRKNRKQFVQLIINPGSTSTKTAVYEDMKQTHFREIRHDAGELSEFSDVMKQDAYRADLIDSFLSEEGIDSSCIDAVVGRGGLLHPVDSGVYEISQDMLLDLREKRYGEHASNLGAVLAEMFSKRFGVPAWIADPVVVDELCEEARISGFPEIERKSIFHALNQKSAARKAAEEMSLVYEESSLITAHMGGGISVAAHVKGRVVDVNNALDGEGPFSPERSGGVPAGQLARLALSGKYTPEELQKRISGRGGMFAYLGTKNMEAVGRRIQEGDSEAAFYVKAMAFQIAKEICSLLAVCPDLVDAVVLTGGLSQFSVLVDEVVARVSPYAPVRIVPGEREMLALAENGLAVLQGRRQALQYHRK